MNENALGIAVLFLFALCLIGFDYLFDYFYWRKFKILIDASYVSDPKKKEDA